MRKQICYPGFNRSLLATAVALLLPTLAAAQDPSQGTVVVTDEGNAVVVAEGDPMPVIVTGDELVDGWQYELTLYGWAKSIEGQSSGRDVDLNFKDDLLDMLEMAGMVSFEATYGRWLGFAAYEYTKIGVDDDDLDVTLDIPTGGGPLPPPFRPGCRESSTQPTHNTCLKLVRAIRSWTVKTWTLHYTGESAITTMILSSG